MNAVTGAVAETCTSLPWGDNLQCAGTDQSPLHFTGKQRDSESGLDDFGARYFGSSLGRFMSPDDPFADQRTGDPQSWNLYSYVRNNSLSNTDPSGNTCVSDGYGGWIDEGNTGQSCAESFDPSQMTFASATVTLSRDELNLMMLQSLGDTLSSPRQWADLTKHGVEVAMTIDGLRGLGELTGAIIDGLEAARAARAATALADVTSIATKAATTVGNQTVVASSKASAEAAGQEFLGPGAKPITDRLTGAFKGWQSADGSRVVIDTHADQVGEHMNFINKVTHGNLHVRW